MNVPSIGITIWIISGFIPLVFFLDSQNNVNRFLVSMPIQRKQLVLARYLFLLSITLGAMLFLWLFDAVAYQRLPYLILQSMTGFEILQLFIVNSLLLSIYIPFFYYFRNFTRAVTFFMLSAVFFIYSYAVITGNPLISFDDPIRDFLINITNGQSIYLLIFSGIVLYLSFRLSFWLFTKKDIL